MYVAVEETKFILLLPQRRVKEAGEKSEWGMHLEVWEVRAACGSTGWRRASRRGPRIKVPLYVSVFVVQG